MSPVATTLVILALAVVAFVSNRIPLGIVAIGVSVALWLTGILDLGEALAGFGDPTVIFIATLFVVAEALDATGVTAWAGQQVVARGGDRRTPLLVVVCLLVAVLTALISVNGAVAALLPVVVVVATRAGLPPSQMLMPLAFSAHAGSLLALTGTPVNIIVSDAAADAGARPFGFFEFALAGVPLLVGTLLVIVLVGQRLLPDRVPEAAHTGRLPEAFRNTPGTLFVVGIVVLVSLGINNLTDGILNTFVVALLFGIALRTFGVFKPSVLAGIDSFGLMMLAIMILVFGPLATVEPQEVIDLAWPLVLVFTFGVAGIAGFSALVGKLVGYSIPMSIAIGLTALYGFPGTMILSQEAAKGAGGSPEEIAAIEHEILPKMIVAGFSTVTITSVILTGIIAGWIGLGID